jgi:integrase
VDDTDLVNRVAYIRVTLSAAKGGPRESQTKTDGSRRRVMFPEPVVGLLKAWSRQQATERLQAGAGWEASGKVFTTETGGVVDPRNFLRTLQDHAKALGLPAHVGIHMLRHSAATAMLEAGVHVKAVSDALGHSSSQITLDVYGFAVDKVARAAADGLAASFGITVDAPEEKGDTGGNVVPLR